MVQHHDAVGERQCLFLIVRHQDRDAERALKLLQLDLQFLAQLAIERPRGLVEQQDVGLEDDGARQRHALLLAAGELRRAPVLQALRRTCFKASSARRRASAPPILRTPSGNSTFSSTLMCGNKA